MASLSLAQFCEAFAAHFGVPTAVGEATGIFEELGFDSFDAVRLLVWLDAVAEVDVPEPDLPLILTVGDAYAYYELQVRAR